MANESFVPSLAAGELGGPASDFILVEWTDSGESRWEWIAPLHVHHSDDEAWYVLEGVLRFRTGDEVFEAGPNGAVLAPKRTPHAYGNARRGEPVRYVLVMTPKIRALVQALHQPGAGDYATQQTFGPAEAVAPLALPSATVQVVDLLM